MCGETRSDYMGKRGGVKLALWKPLVLGSCTCDCLLVRKLIKKETEDALKKQAN